MAGGTFVPNLGVVGIALSRIRVNRGLTVEEMGSRLGVTRKMASRYLSGDAEMGFLKWLHANETFPELARLIEETEAERAAQGRQIKLELDAPKQESQAA